MKRSNCKGPLGLLQSHGKVDPFGPFPKKRQFDPLHQQSSLHIFTVDYGSYDDLSRIENFQHSIQDLEDEINKKIIDDCKIDACIDRFIDCLKELPGDARTAGWRPRPLESFRERSSNEFRNLTTELENNLRRLVPCCLEEGDKNELLSGRINDKLRADLYLRRLKQDDQDQSPSQLPKSILPILAEKHYRLRTGHVEDANTLLNSASTKACRQLKESIDTERTTASFACGGKIPIGDVKPRATQSLSESPLHRSMSSGQQGSVSWREGWFYRSATMRHPEYRKAGKLDPSQFATSFHPAHFGIIENIEQILRPSISTDIENCLQFRKLSSELYKLNVCVLGTLRALREHVDTPRSENQIGSWVVCLPSPFKGGRLRICHHGQEVQFDWSEQSASTIQWAAFYSDCEHEIMKITEGDRITLTYNLYVTEPTRGVIPPHNPVVDPESLPLYGFLKSPIAEPGFMRQGGVLGIFCSHAYPHNTDLAHIKLPRALKGADLVLYSVFKSLGIEVEVLPVLEYGGQYGPQNSKRGITGTIQNSRRKYLKCFHSAIDDLANYLGSGEELYPTYGGMLSQQLADPTDIDQYWKTLLLSRRVVGLKEVIFQATKRNIPASDSRSDEVIGVCVGTNLQAYTVTNKGNDDEQTLVDVANIVWPGFYLPGITWITDPKHEEMAFTQIVYGNEASVGTRYSCAAILAVIPQFSERRL
ncbi:hypothetical protein PHISCL_05297 [Aspergillus sclerotialis]|uniref:Prolyl 4-hydroxylase alpha subunit Fe(2+) 2OG dioxygenase domain-containing protein n=1 Tax=Aspergillus sclerotialis TaxID=2070753 RepID=A0A3A2ZWI7_9EURO|nr:hypothetical protein PHISCL_05297 [Aspergillus sclerotialis]